MKTLKHSLPHKKQVLIVDDHPLLREGLACLINRQADLAVCGEADNAQAALVAAAIRKPDLMVVDVSLPGRDGIDLTKELRTRYPKLPVLVFSMHDEAVYAERALRAGARGYVMKRDPTERHLRAIRRVLAGEIVASSAVVAQLARQLTTTGGLVPVKLLSDRELEIFRLFGEGRNRRLIATALHLSIKTIETHRANICRKLGLRGAVELRRHATEFVQAEIRAVAG